MTQPHDVAYARINSTVVDVCSLHPLWNSKNAALTKPGLLMVFGTNVPEVVQWGCLRVPTAPRTQEDSMNSA